MTHLSPRMRLAIGTTISALVAFALCVVAPLRQTSGDTVGGRVGGAVLRCGGGFDLSRLDWMRERTEEGKYLYWLQRDAAGDVSSIFGPGPAVVGALALVDFGDGDAISDRDLRLRERYAAGALLGLATALLALAIAARARLRVALLGAIVAAASFAGAATLGQGLWQATVALPFLLGGLATLAWAERVRLLAALTPGLLLFAAMMRPTILPLALGIGIAWCLQTRGRATWLTATLIAAALSIPLVVWNLAHLETPFPAGQWSGNTRMTEDVFVFSRGHIGYALGGLLLSPGRGLLWYAPVAILAVVCVLRGSDRIARIVGIGVVLQVLMIACFFKWYGGMAYGPRLLSEVVWIAMWLATVGYEWKSRGSRILLGATLVVTVVVGQLGLWLFRPEQWETRRMLLEIDENAFWDVVDSPITATFHDTSDALDTFDSLPIESLRCENGWLRSERDD